MPDNVFTTLSAKEVKRLKKAISWYKWNLFLAGSFIFIQLGCVAGKIYQIRRLSSDTSWAKIGELGFTRDFPVNGMYSGVQIRVASLAEDAFMYLIGTGLFVVLCFAFRYINRRNRILLHYIEQNQRRAKTQPFSMQTPIPKVDLHEFNALGLILSWRTGIIYTNQVAGLGCLHPEIEGAFVPLFDGIGHPVIHSLSQHFRGDWHSLTDSDAEIIDGILRRSNLGFIVTDRQRLTDSYESWVFVELHEDVKNSVFPLLSGFGKQKGILTWPNSD